MQATLHRDHERFQDLRHHVLGRHEVDVVAAGVLQIEHDLCELAGTYLGAFAELARLKILTEDTAQIAPAEKNRARPVPAAQTIFFAEMWKRAGHPREPAAFADADFIVVAVDLAIARADAA